MAKSILYKIKESPNAYLPLKPIAEHLWHVLDKCGVWSPFPCIQPATLTVIIANGGESSGHRIIGTAGQITFRISP